MQWKSSCRGVDSTTTWPTAKPRSLSAHHVPSSAWRSSEPKWSRELSCSSRRWDSDDLRVVNELKNCKLLMCYCCDPTGNPIYWNIFWISLKSPLLSVNYYIYSFFNNDWFSKHISNKHLTLSMIRSLKQDPKGGFKAQVVFSLKFTSSCSACE